MNELAAKITIVIAILAVFSGGSIAWSVANYSQGIRAVANVQLELSTLELRDDDDPQVFTAFQLKNRSSMDINLDAFDFSVYLNRNFMGSNYEPFVKQTLYGSEETSMEFEIPIRPFYQQYIVQAEQGQGFSWSVRGRAKVVLPAYRYKAIWMNVQASWSGNP